MSSSFYEVVNSNVYIPFVTASNYDVSIRTEGVNQRMFIGNGSNAYSNAGITLNSNLVGINNPKPAFNLDVAGNVNFSGTLNQGGVPYVGSQSQSQSQWTTGGSGSSSNIYYMSNIGIGKSNPAFNLDVAGNVNFSGTLNQGGVPYVGSQWTTGGSGSSSNIYYMSNIGIGKSNPAFNLDVAGNVNFSGTLNQGGVPYVGSQWTTGSSSNIYYMSNVGIGVSNPSYALDVAGNAMLRSNLIVSGTLTASNIVSSNLTIYNNEQVNSNLSVLNNLNIGGNLTYTNQMLFSGLYIQQSTTGSQKNATTTVTSINGFSKSAQGSVAITMDGPGAPNAIQFLNSNATEFMRINSNGFVGINNPNPAFNLDIAGNVNFSGTLNQGGVPYVGTQWTTRGSGSSSNIYYMSNVGIGTSNPAFNLDVAGNVNFSGTLNQGGVPYVGSQWTTGSSSNIYYMSNVGIGVSNPSYALDLAGNAMVRSNVLVLGTSTTSNIITCTSNVYLTNANCALSNAGNLQVGGSMTVSNINFTGALTSNGVPFVGGSSSVAIDDSDASNISSSNMSVVFNRNTTATNGASWAASYSIGGYSCPTMSTTDVYGNSYITTSIFASGTVYNSNGSFNNINQIPLTGTNAQIQCIKYSSNGQALFSFGMTNSNVNSYVNQVITDSNCNVYLIGTYSSQTNVSPTIYNSNAIVSASVALPSNSDNNKTMGFCLKYNSNGIAQTSYAIGNVNYCSAGFNAGCIDTSGLTLYLGGYYYGASPNYYVNNALQSSFALTASGLVANNPIPTFAFYLPINISTGVVTGQYYYTTTGIASINGLVADASSNLYTCGNYSSSLTNFSGKIATNTTGYQNSFILKHASAYNSGALAYATSINSSVSSNNINRITIDANGSIYAVGTYSGASTSIYNSNMTSSGLSLVTPAGTAGYVIKYNSSGIAQWANSINGSSTGGSSPNTKCSDLKLDLNSNVYVAGGYIDQYSNNTIYNPNNVISSYILPKNASSNSAAYWVKYSTNGIAQAAVTASNSSVFSTSVSISLDPGSNVYLAGSFGNSTTLSTLGYNLYNPTVGPSNNFLFKYSQQVIGIKPYNLPASLGINNNGVIKYILNASATNATLNITDSNNVNIISTSTIVSSATRQLAWYYSNWYIIS